MSRSSIPCGDRPCSQAVEQAWGAAIHLHSELPGAAKGTAAATHESSPPLDALGYQQELKRSLSLTDLLVYGLVSIVPGAPVAVFGIVFNASKGMVPLVYFIGLVAMVFTAYSYVLMSRAYPVAGSVYTYAARSIGEAAGFVAGWAILLDYLLAPALAYVACAIAIHAIVPSVPDALWVVVLLALATAVNYLGIETTARTNFILLGLQFVILVIFMVVGIAAAARGTAGAHLSLQPLYNPAVLTPGVIFGALSLAVLSFLGFDAISILSEEARHGPSPVGRATVLSLCICALLFMVETYLASLFVLGRTHFAPGHPTNEAFYTIAGVVGGTWLKFLIAVPGVLIGAVASALAGQAATARLLYSMARDRKLPHWLAHVHPVRKVPERAIFLVAAITLAIGVFMVSRLELLTSMVSFGALIGFLLLHVSVMAHFRKQGSRAWWKHYVAPAIGLAIIAFVLWNAQANAKIAGGCWLVLGAGFYFALRARGRSADLPTL